MLNENKQNWLSRSEVQFIAWIVTVVIAIIVPFVTYKIQTTDNLRRIVLLESANASQKDKSINNELKLEKELGKIRSAILLLNMQFNIISGKLGLKNNVIDMEKEYDFQ